MQITKHTDYAYRVLIFLGSMQQERTTIAAVSEYFSVSKAHLMKVVNTLANHGWVESTRGKSGGIRLAVAPREINLREVLELMEQTLDPINCDVPLCQLRGCCQLKPILLDAQSLYLAHLGKHTLADVLNADTTRKISFLPTG